VSAADPAKRSVLLPQRQAEGRVRACRASAPGVVGSRTRVLTRVFHGREPLPRAETMEAKSKRGRPYLARPTWRSTDRVIRFRSLRP
jgi:hypothetical protein